MPVPLIAAAGAAPAAVSGIKSGISAVGGALGFGPDRMPSGENKNLYNRHVAQIDGYFSSRNAAGIQAAITAQSAAPGWNGGVPGFAWGPESRAYGQTKLDQLLAANRARAGGGAPAPMFTAGPNAAAGTDSFTVANGNQAAPSTAGQAAGSNWPLMIGGALVLGGLGWYFMRGRRK